MYMVFILQYQKAQTNAYNLVRMTLFWINLRHLWSKSKDGNAKQLLKLFLIQTPTLVKSIVYGS
jgi:hypothetical protein